MRKRIVSGSGMWAAAWLVVVGGCAGGVRALPPDVSATAAFAGATNGGAPTVPVTRAIAPQDLLEVTIFGAAELGRTVRVSDAGEISLPLIGIVAAAGRTPRELEIELAGKLREYMREPHVSVEVRESAAQPVYVLGEVQQPGAFTAADREPLTVLRAVSVARGFKPTAALSRAVVVRTTEAGERIQLPVNLDRVLEGREPDMVLQPNDVVYVPKNTERAIALGVIDAMLRLVTFRAVF